MEYQQVLPSTPHNATFLQYLIDCKIELLFQDTARDLHSKMIVKVPPVNEYLTRCQRSPLGTLSFFLVDNLLDTLDMNGTRAIFRSESGFKMTNGWDPATLTALTLMARDVRSSDAVILKLVAWYAARRTKHLLPVIEIEFSWKVWRAMSCSHFIHSFKKIYEGSTRHKAISMIECIKKQLHQINSTVNNEDFNERGRRGTMGNQRSRRKSTASKRSSRSKIPRSISTSSGQCVVEKKRRPKSSGPVMQRPNQRVNKEAPGQKSKKVFLLRKQSLSIVYFVFLQKNCGRRRSGPPRVGLSWHINDNL